MAFDSVDDLPVRAELLSTVENGYTMRFAVEDAAVLMLVRRRPQSALSDAFFDAESPRAGALFWRMLARWLGVSVPAGVNRAPGARRPFIVESLGGKKNSRGDEWRVLRLEFDEECTSFWVRVCVDLDAGDFRAKQLEFSERLIARLSDALGDVDGLPAISFEH